MRVRHLLLCTTTLLEIYHAHGHCIDIHSRIVSQGLHYVPGGTNPCTLCICDKGGPKWCKSVLCSPPQNCKSFQVGSSCCEFKCLDDILSSHDNYKDTYDVALRFIATTVTAVLSISLLFFLYNRLKRNKSLQHHNLQHDEQRNLSNVGYIAGNYGYNQHNLGYLGSGHNEIEIRYEETSTNFSLWKPPGNYFPPGEAPPPYEEAMRSAQNDLSHNIHNATTQNTLINSIASAYPQEMTPAFIHCRHEEQPMSASVTEIPNISSNTHQYVNVRVQMQNYPQGDHKKQDRAVQSKLEVSYENVAALKGHYHSQLLAGGGTSTADRHRPTSSGLTKAAYHRSRSRSQVVTNATIATSADVASKPAPVSRLSAAPSSSTMTDSYELVPHMPQLVGMTSTSTMLSNSCLRYANETCKKAKRNESYNMHLQPQGEVKKSVAHRTLPKNLRELLSNADGLKIAGTISSQQLNTGERDVSKVTFRSTPKIDNIAKDLPSPIVIPVAEASTNVMKHDKPKDVRPKSLLTYQSLSQDEEDYRSECENCKTANVTGANDDGEVVNETMSLQRRPLSEAGYELSYRTSLTLPIHSRKPRTYPCTSNVREKWFPSMQQTSSEESD